MEYEKLNLSNGTVLNEAHLAHIEQGIADAEKVGADAVLYTEQTLTEEQKQQACGNIDAVSDIGWYPHAKHISFAYNVGQKRLSNELDLVRYDASQTGLTEEQKAQARANIGAAAVGEGGGGTLEGAVLYTEQTLTEEQQQQACVNIGTKKTVIMEVTVGDYIQSRYGGEYTVESASMTYDEVREAVNAGANVECHVSWPEDLPGPDVLPFNHISEGMEYCEFSAHVGGGDVANVYNFILEPDGVCWLQDQALLTDERMDKVYLSTELEQSFTEEQKAQGRANLGIDEYIDQVFLGGAW